MSSDSKSSHHNRMPQQQYQTSSSSNRSYDADKSKKGEDWFSGITLLSFDLYQKVEEDFKVKTAGGGYLSLAGWIIVCIMLVGQTYTFLTPRFHEHMVVDTTLGQLLPINIDITFHALTCAEAHLDAMDVAGDNQLNMEDTMFKQRISATGEVIGEMTKTAVNADAKVEIKAIPGDKAAAVAAADKCLSCYGAESNIRKCCNTCQGLKEAYTALGWSTSEIIKTSVQCLSEPSNPFANVSKGEGCRVMGSLKVNKVSGNIHIAHGESIVRDGRHIHQFLPQEAPSYNISHTIHSFSFGKKYPSMPKGPLDGMVKIVDPVIGTGLYQYFIKIIPTIYNDEFKQRGKTYTNQYTMTERFRALLLPEFPRLPDGTPDFLAGQRQHQQAVLPGIFFVYDLSPFLVEVVRSRVPFLHYFTKVCATVGGVFAVMGVVDKAWFSVQNLVKSGKSEK